MFLNHCGVLLKNGIRDMLIYESIMAVKGIHFQLEYLRYSLHLQVYNILVVYSSGEILSSLLTILSIWQPE